MARWNINQFLLLCVFIIEPLTFIVYLNNDRFNAQRQNSEKMKSMKNLSKLKSVKNLTYIYENYKANPGFHHWLEYAAHYDFHLPILISKFPKSKTIKMLEIGVQSGGSMEVWKSYFSSRSFYYVGMDINKHCKKFEDISRNISIEIGNQLSRENLLQICRKYGPFDFIVDDGGHTSKMMRTSLNTLFLSDSCMSKHSLYVIEDMCTMVYTKFSEKDSDIPSIVSEIFRKMHFYWYNHKDMKTYKAWNNMQSSDKDWADLIESISLYDSMMFIHRGYGSGPLTLVKRGRDWI